MPLNLGPSRKRNTFSLKAALKRRSQHAKRVLADLRGVEKRRTDLRSTLDEVRAVVGAAIAQAQAQLPVAGVDIDRSKPITEKRATRLEKRMRASTAALALLAQKVGLLTKAITREDASLKAEATEMRDARKKVEIFMEDTLRVANDISLEVTAARADFADDLREDKKQQLGDPYLISSLMRTRTRALNATATGIYPRRRGGAVRKPKTTDAPLAVKGASIAVKAGRDRKPTV